MAGGLGMVLGALIGQVLWLGFCFGTVIVGVFLLFVMPLVLIWPVMTGVPAGLLLLATGYAMWDNEPRSNYKYTVTEEEIALDAKIAEAKKKALALSPYQNKTKD